MLRIGVQNTPIQKTYEIVFGSDSVTIDFLGSNRQFDWIEITVKLSNFTEIYSLTCKKKI